LSGPELTDLSQRRRRPGGGLPPPTNAPDAHGVPSDLMARWVAAMRRFDVPPGQGLTRQEASAAFRENGLDPRSSGSWARHGWITREGDRRYITAKGKEWLAEHDAV